MNKQAHDWPVISRAHDALRTVVAGVGKKWTSPTPCTEWNVTQVLQHAAGDQQAFAAAITGGPGPTDNPFAPSGTIEGNPTAFLETALLMSATAWATVSPSASEVATPLPQGAFAPSIAAGACALDAAVHAWDIARATGQTSPITENMAKTIHEAALEVVEPLRSYGVYAAALQPLPNDNEVAKLLRYLGRNPNWAH